MNRDELFELNIERPDKQLMKDIKDRWDKISKPLDSLGDFENVICRIGAIQGTVTPSIDKKTLIVMCSDNGIVAEGVSQSESDITRAVATALGKGISSASTMARKAGAEIVTVDIGIDCDEKIDGVLDRKVRRSTSDFLEEPAMTEEEMLSAIQTGIDLVKELSEKGVNIIATGEMGIGNTTTSAAVLSALFGKKAEVITGRGAGLSDAGLIRKIEVINQGLATYKFTQNTDREKVYEMLRCLGGLDIAGLVGVCIGAGICHIPVVLDGLISSCAGLVAGILVSNTEDYMIASHSGREKGHQMAVNALGLKPIINGDMALGEGTGALMAFPVLDMVMDFYNNAAKFSDYEIEDYTRFD